MLHNTQYSVNKVVFTRLKKTSKRMEQFPYEHANNSFYKYLAYAGFTDRELKPNESSMLSNFGLTIIDIYSSNQPELQSAFVESYIKTIMYLRPEIICFNGKEAAKSFLNSKTATEIKFGLQEQAIGYTKLYVAPSTSLRELSETDMKWWKALKTFIDTKEKNEQNIAPITFTISVDDTTLIIKELIFEKDLSFYEVWDKGELQFILEHYVNLAGNETWKAANEEAVHISSNYIDAIGKKIQSYYE